MPPSGDEADRLDRERFIQAYVGPHDPEDVLRWLTDPAAPGVRGATSPLLQLGRARRALYRPDPTPADRDAAAAAERRYAAHLSAVAMAADASRDVRIPPPVATNPAPTTPPAHARWRTGTERGAARAVVLLVAVALVAGLIGYSARPRATIDLSTSGQVQRLIVDSAGRLAAEDYLRLYPEALPAEWRDASLISHRRLRRAATLELPGRHGTLLLVYVACGPADGRFHWSLSGSSFTSGTIHNGRCGGLRGSVVALIDRSSVSRRPLAVSVDGNSPFSVTALVR
ncbi:hypothetical protein CLV52_0898 [Amnibacterium kyonggiense]|uniref:Uncharacterized protein n=1 Tax=Amnibacterium kyonggiense TaxID=595671 RepID=A0A4R7FRB1_9MICO|nr:hypothetical protein CLV52_0898 [Amnibacterium kyonggiense]